MKLMICLAFMGWVTGLYATTGAGPKALGWENGNAGDTYAYEFVLSARLLAQRLDLLVKNNKAAFDTAGFRAAIGNTEVASEEHVYLRGIERDAVNYFPMKRLIKVGRAHWRELRRSTKTYERLRLVLHEYLWVAGVRDDQFHESIRLMSLLNIGNFSPSVWWNPVNPMNYVVPTLTFAPADCGFKPATLNVKSSDETLDLEPQGECKDAYRRVKIVKSAGTTPASSNVRGLFHSYEITVFDGSQQKVGEMLYEPGWGECLIPEKESCRGSGKMSVGGVELVFWFLVD